jgi:DNA-binding beta-propeller fold protein YncE
VLAACINSTGATSSQCNTLFTTATRTGAAGGTAPTDTATAAINIAHFPSTTGGSTLFNLIAGIGTPFQPSYSSATSVPDWTMPIVYTGGGLNTAQNSSSIALDSLGNVWIADFATSALTKFSPLGAPLSGSSGFTGGGLSSPNSLAIDASDNVLAANYQGSNVSKLTNAGAPASIFSGASIQSPGNIAIDASGNIWVGDYTGSGGVSEIDKNGNALSTGGPFGTSPALGTANAIALDATGNLYVANGGGAGYVSKFGPTGSYIATSSNQTVVGGLAYPNGIAIDASGNLWTANGWIDVSKLNSSLVPLFTNGIAGGGIGTISHNASGGNVLGTTGVSIDGAGHAWFSLLNDLVAELAADGTALTNASGITVGPGGPYPTLLPNGIAVDSAGNVWIISLGTNTLTELLGAAVPVATPLTPGKLGTRP